VRGDLNDNDDNIIIPLDLIYSGNDLAALVDCTYPALTLPHPTDYFCECCHEPIPQSVTMPRKSGTLQESLLQA
jgi:hypothetical protein